MWLERISSAIGGRGRRSLAPMFLAFGLTLGLSAQAQKAVESADETSPLSQRVANYRIEASLDVEARLLTGTEVIHWRNLTEHATSELQLHLYFNAWLNEQSSFFRAAVLGPGPPSARRLGPDDWAYQNVRGIRLLSLSGEPAWQSGPLELETRFIQPDDGNEHDRTVMQVDLPRPVEPGGELEVEIEWQLKIPAAIRRVGVEGEYFLMGQWFPKLGVFEPDGTWNCHQFIQTEFYADYGVYHVTLETPKGWVVGATGSLVESTSGENNETRRYLAEDVQDFAWTTSPHFAVHRDRFEHATLPPVDIEVLLLPDHSKHLERYMSSAKISLELYGLWFKPYPWDRLTIVDPPSGTETGGMEYPMFVTSESRWFLLPKNRLLEANTAHEIGHLWWFSAVGNNQFEDAFLDEALTTYSHRRLLDQVYYPNRFEKRYLQGFLPVAFPSVETAQPTHGADSYDTERSRLALENIDTPSYQIDERTYFSVPYVKGSLMIVTLERYLGWQTFREVLRTYADRFWFRHPEPDDFFQVVNEVSGRDLSWYFDQVYRDSVLFDYAVDRVVSRPARPARGYVSLGEEPAWQAGVGLGIEDSEFVVHSMVQVRRWKEGVFPVSVRVSFEDGTAVVEQWDGTGLWQRFRYDKPTAVRTVEVDPDQVLVLDVNRSNNSWSRRPSAKQAATKWTAKWLIWLQSVMELAAGLS